MRQEHRFVAELYRYLAPFIDTSADVYLSLDGIAARRGVSSKKFDDADVPDLWFTLVGHTQPVLLEAKIVDDKRRVTVNRNQLMAWRSNGRGGHRPTAWVATNEAFN